MKEKLVGDVEFTKEKEDLEMATRVRENEGAGVSLFEGQARKWRGLQAGGERLRLMEWREFNKGVRWGMLMGAGLLAGVCWLVWLVERW